MDKQDSGIMYTIKKKLSANDTSETGGHQAGILIPKDPRILDFFPQLEKEKYNPRVHILFEDPSGNKWEFAFIYYNNKFFDGTRNEYRLTRMTKFMRASDLKSGDELVFKAEKGSYFVSYKRKNNSSSSSSFLKLGSSWKVIQI